MNDLIISAKNEKKIDAVEVKLNKWFSLNQLRKPTQFLDMDPVLFDYSSVRMRQMTFVAKLRDVTGMR